MKTIFSKMKHQNYHSIANIMLIILFTITTISCSKSDDICSETNLCQNKISQEIKDLIYFKGNESASVVLINSQGGPGYTLDDSQVNLFFQGYNTDDVLMANVHQSQTQNFNPFISNIITLEQAVNYNADSVENLFKTIKFFKDQGRTVYVLGVSYGAFLTQELISEYGINVADRYLIITGRLDINDVVWQAALEGKNTEFQNGSTPVILPNIVNDVMERNSMNLFAGIAKNRYTERLNFIADLSKVMYVYGTQDEAVGTLNNEEIQFLQTRNATVISGNGNHDETYENLVVEALKDFFGIAPK